MSKIIMKAMCKITLRRFYQALVGLCQLLVLVYLACALLLAAYTIMAAAEAVQAISAAASSIMPESISAAASATTPESISLTGIFVGGLCLYIPAIYYFCRHV